MRIEITTAFNDLTKPEDEDRRVEVGTKMTVTAERGAELIGIGLAKDLTDDAPAPSETPTTPNR